MNFMRDKTTGTIMANWKDHFAQLFGNQELHLQHTLHKSELFTDENLAKVLDELDQKYYHINTRATGPDGHKRRREGDDGGLSGKDLLKAIKKGDIWINIHMPPERHPKFGEMMNQMYDEFEARVPSFHSYKRQLTLLISSPNMVVPYHADVPGQMLWQVRGHKTVYVYPNVKPYLTQNSIEKMVIGEFHEVDVKYEDWFDEGANVYDLDPGYMLHWPLNLPHRVDNKDSMNVSMTTEHFTTSIRNTYGVNYTNAFLRKLGFKTLQNNTSGLMMYAKLAIAGAIKYSGLGKKAKKPYEIEFSVDLNAPNCVKDITPYMLSK